MEHYFHPPCTAEQVGLMNHMKKKDRLLFHFDEVNEHMETDQQRVNPMNHTKEIQFLFWEFFHPVT